MAEAVATKTTPDKGMAQVQERPRERPQAFAPSGLGADILALHDTAGNQAVSTVLRNSNSYPLDASVLAFMESRFNHDFSQVQVHTDSAAARSADNMDANAYTVGNDIVFGPGKFDSKSPSGQQLLAHELTHVVQQSRQSQTSSFTQSDLEQDAESATRNLIHGHDPIQVRGTSPLQIARNEKGGALSDAPRTISASYTTSEEKLDGGRVRIRVQGTVGDPIERPGLEKKYPLPQDVGLPGYDRWHLAGPNAIGAEEGILYAPNLDKPEPKRFQLLSSIGQIV